jgi:type IV secretory pathway TrbD component
MTDVIAVQLHLILIPSLMLAFALLGALCFFGFQRWFSNCYGLSGWSVTGVALWICAGVIALVWIATLIPFDPKYHVVYKLEGRVESVTNILDEGSGQRTTIPIVSLSGYDNPIYVTDSRIVGQKGKDVSLTCTIAWSPYAMDATKCDLKEIKK